MQGGQKTVNLVEHSKNMSSGNVIVACCVLYFHVYKLLHYMHKTYVNVNRLHLVALIGLTNQNCITLKLNLYHILSNGKCYDAKHSLHYRNVSFCMNLLMSKSRTSYSATMLCCHRWMSCWHTGWVSPLMPGACLGNWKCFGHPDTAAHGDTWRLTATQGDPHRRRMQTKPRPTTFRTLYHIVWAGTRIWALFNISAKLNLSEDVRE